MSRKRYRYIFGPVPSRRLGRSLGVDLVPMKVCTFDCIYCQIGRTTTKTLERDAYVPADEVLAELVERLAERPVCDYITLSGSGEPTLHRELGRIVAGIKRMTDIPLAVLTNGALLADEQVRRDLAEVDLVLPSLDAGDAETFERINRPAAGVTFEAVVAGLKAFRRRFAGRIHLEVFFAAGVNDDDRQVRKIKAIVDQIRLDRIDVNTVARPPAEAGVAAVGDERLEEIRAMLGPTARIIAPRAFDGAPAEYVTDEQVLSMLRRRPCTLADLADGLGLSPAKIAGPVARLVGRGLVRLTRQDDREYYQPAQDSHDPPPG